MKKQHPTLFDLKPHHCGISVPDLETSVAWYRDMLGFSVKARLTLEAVGAQRLDS